MGLRFLSSQSLQRTNGRQSDLQRTTGRQSDLQAKSTTRNRAPVQAPPWVMTKEDLDSKYWLGRKAAQKKWIKTAFQKKVVNPRIESWNSFFASRPQTLHSVNTLLRVFNSRGEYQKALAAFREMEQRGIMPDEFSYVNALTACAALKDLEQATGLFREMVAPPPSPPSTPAPAYASFPSLHLSP